MLPALSAAPPAASTASGDASPPSAALGPPFAVLLRLALPTVAALMSRTLMGFVDFWMVSALGVDEQAAIVPATLVVFAVVAFGMGHMTSVSTLVAQAYGRRGGGGSGSGVGDGSGANRSPAESAGGDDSATGAWAWQGVWASLVFGVAAVCLWPLVDAVFAFAGHSPRVQELETGYVRIGLLGVFPTVVAIAVSNFFTSVQRPAITLWATVIANLANVAGNWVLINGNLGAPALGMDGAAWATTGAAFVQAAILVGWMLRPRARAAFGTWPPPRPALGAQKRMLRLGVPASLQSGLEFMVFGFFIVGIVASLGTVAAAASNIAFKFSEIAFMPCVGLSIAVTAVVGESLGAGDHARARRTATVAMRMAAVWIGFCTLLAFSAGPWVVAQVAAGPEVAALGVVLLWIGVSYQWSDAVQFVYLGALRGAGDNRFPAVFTGFSATLVLLGGGWVAVSWFDAWAPHMAWVMLSTYVAVQAVAFFWRWRRGTWESIRA